jgi:hypothetical protein
MTATQRTLDLLTALEKLGFEDSAFATLHHFRSTRGTEDTIEAHRKYCESHLSLRQDGTNEKVQRRLALVLDAYLGGGFKSGRKEIFLALAEAAVLEIPVETQNVV